MAKQQLNVLIEQGICLKMMEPEATEEDGSNVDVDKVEDEAAGAGLPHDVQRDMNHC